MRFKHKTYLTQNINAHKNQNALSKLPLNNLQKRINS